MMMENAVADPLDAALAALADRDEEDGVVAGPSDAAVAALADSDDEVLEVVDQAYDGDDGIDERDGVDGIGGNIVLADHAMATMGFPSCLSSMANAMPDEALSSIVLEASHFICIDHGLYTDTVAAKASGLGEYRRGIQEFGAFECGRCQCFWEQLNGNILNSSWKSLAAHLDLELLVYIQSQHSDGVDLHVLTQGRCNLALHAKGSLSVMGFDAVELGLASVEASVCPIEGPLASTELSSPDVRTVGTHKNLQTEGVRIMVVRLGGQGDYH